MRIEQARFEEAWTALDGAAELAPVDLDVECVRALWHLRQGLNPAEAMACADRAGQPAVKAWALAENGETAQAMEVAESAPADAENCYDAGSPATSISGGRWKLSLQGCSER